MTRRLLSSCFIAGLPYALTPLFCSYPKHFSNCRGDVGDLTDRESRMNKKHQACLRQLCSIVKASDRPHRWRESFLKVNLAADSARARHTFRTNSGHQTIAIPALAEQLRSNIHIVFVIRMTEVARRNYHPKCRNLRELLVQNSRISPS